MSDEELQIAPAKRKKNYAFLRAMGITDDDIRDYLVQECNWIPIYSNNNWLYRFDGIWIENIDDKCWKHYSFRFEASWGIYHPADRVFMCDVCDHLFYALDIYFIFRRGWT